MAHPTTVNSTIEALVSSLLPSSGNTSRLRKAKDNFVKRIRYHTFGRTNQFEVATRLSGVEEKLQILTYDDLSDSLHARLNELKAHEDRWLPDVLDLLLKLSNEPTHSIKVDALQKAKQRADSPPPLKWSEIEADDPIDRNDPIWHVEEYSDLSSDEDLFEIPSEESSPEIKKIPDWKTLTPVVKDTPFIPVDDNESHPTAKLRDAQFWCSLDESVSITELQAIRECLFMLQGLPTSLFRRSENEIVPCSKFTLHHLSQDALRQVLCALGKIGQRLEAVRCWLEMPKKLHFLQAMSASIQSHSRSFDAELAKMQSNLINPSEFAVLSLVNLLFWAEEKAAKILIIDRIIDQMNPRQHSHSHDLDVLFNQICQSELSGDDPDQVAKDILTGAWAIYTKPIERWIRTGHLYPGLDSFFVQAGKQENLSQLWSDWVVLDEKSEITKPPDFLKPFVQKILSCGKTAMFLRVLKVDYDEGEISRLDLPTLANSNLDDIVLEMAPFREVWYASMESKLSSTLLASSQLLLRELGENCSLWATLHALERVYFAKSGPITESIDSKIFKRIDRCDTGWNDRFLIADLLEDKFSGPDGLEMDRLIVHSRQTTARNMESRRRSVKILGDISVEYILPWQLANIISQSALGSYRRVALMLHQIRRAKHALLRRAHFFVQGGLLHLDAGERKVAQALHYRLLLFGDVLYDHLTGFVIEGATHRIRQELKSSVDVELMIASFDSYTSKLEDACLTAKKLRVIQDALISALDLCIRFSDVVSTPVGRGEADFEASSFISARSRHDKRTRKDSDGEDSSDEESDDGEGYSTFVVLEDESPVAEIKKIQSQFERYVVFIVAGLRGLAKTRPEEMGWEILAERLDWKKGPPRHM